VGGERQVYDTAMSNLRSLLEAELLDAEQKLKEEVDSFLALKNDVLTSKKDVEAYRKALEAASRNNGSRYIAKPVITAADPYLEEKTKEEETGLKNGQIRLPLPPLPPKATKMDEINKIIIKKPGLASRQVFDALQEEILPMPISIDDVYRALPRLIRQSKIWRDKNMRYYAADYVKGSEEET
jgi:hypothetical protein